MQLEELFCSSTTIENRKMVRSSPVFTEPLESELITGHIYENNGQYREYWMRYSPDNLARFICSCDKDKLICNGDDFALLNTQGKFMDLCIKNDLFRNKIINALTIYQKDPLINTSFEYEK